MDELRGFFLEPCPSSSQLKVLRGGVTDGLRITAENEIEQLIRREDHRHAVVPSGTDYAREVKEREIQMYMKSEIDRGKFESISGGLDSLEQLSSWGPSSSVLNVGELTEEAMTEVYRKYSFKKREDTTKLAIEEYKQEIIDRINGFQVVIIEGPTGCGKTTQVPQWILDDCYQKRQPCKIVVTQPRRIAAISIAKRVAHERGWDVGGVVGYQVGLDSKCFADTRIHYVTTGILLQKLVAAKTLNEYTHIILDEVHERGQEMDFLLLVVRRLLYTVSPRVKIILMSATFKKISFADYFSFPSPTVDSLNTSCIEVMKNEASYTVKVFYLNHLTKFGSILQKATPKEEPSIAPEMHHLVLKLINAFEHIDKQEDHYEDRSQVDLPSVLVFLPGINEIEELYECLNDKDLREKIGDAECPKYNWWVLPLHSTITADEQIRVFQRAPSGCRKIILATNIAESSITVPDIKYVIDYCLIKQLVADPSTNFTSLQLCWASKTNCEQRAGRAGRVRDGRVYRLVFEKSYELFSQECRPEILRCPLERLVLLAKMLDIGPPTDTLALAMDPPDMSNIHRTILVLKEVGGLKKMMKNGEKEEWCPSDGEITYLGRIMAKLPLDVRASKLIVLGHIYGCLEPAIVMAAAMSVKNIFSSPFQERLNAYNSKLTWADGSTSDCIAFYNAYRVWCHFRQTQYFKQPGQSEHQWARKSFLQIRALKELDDLVRELRRRLSREGIDTPTSGSLWSRSELPLALKLIMAGAVYPQYFVQVSQDESRERDAVRTLGGHDPRNTVYLKNFPDNQPGEVYSASIKKAIRKMIGDEPHVFFDNNSQKVYLTFGDKSRPGNADANDPTIPGQVVLPVYKAIKARQLRIDIRIPLMPPEEAKRRAEILEKEKQDINMSKLVPRLPEIDEVHFPLLITQQISVSKFWVQYNFETTAKELGEIQKALNRATLLANTKPVNAGDLFAGPYVDTRGTTMHRVKVMKKLPRDMCEVLFIDFGTVMNMNECNLYELPETASEAPPLAMQCVLAEIAPAPLLNRHMQWSQNAEKLFMDLISKGNLIGKVYSVTHGIVHIELFADGGKISVNKELVKQGLAVPSEESYESKMNHDLREKNQEMNLAQKQAHNKEQLELAYSCLHEAAPPHPRQTMTDVCLKGPFSPLETVAHCIMYASHEKQVTIEWNSVNSVLLDTEPQEVYERMLIAADVGHNETNSKLTLRHTTLMPNIPGLPAIVALLFCPMAELRRDLEGTRYVSALCGLGYTDDDAPLFPEHDLLVDIDADLSVDDVGTINHIRHLMDYMMLCGEGQDHPTENEYRAEVPKTIRKNIIELLRKRRKHREPQSVPNAWEWKSVPDGELLEITNPNMVEGAVIYPLHAPQELKPMSREQLLLLKKANDELKSLVSRASLASSEDLVCKLCSTGPLPAHAMRIHLYSKAHQEKEEDLRVFQR